MAAMSEGIKANTNQTSLLKNQSAFRLKFRVYDNF